MLFRSDLAPRCLRDLTFMAAQRPGLVPVLGDARQHAAWGVLVPTKVPWLFQDVAQAGQVDILVNNAGMVAYRRQEFQTEIFRRILDVNLTSIMTLSELLKPSLAEVSGSIINISSLTSFFASSGNPAYGASKAGIVQLTKSLAVAWAADGVRVNAIAPGWIATSMTEVSQNREAINSEILRRTPVGRWGQPEDIAGVALFLASPLASYVTGETISVDGGFSCSI